MSVSSQQDITSRVKWSRLEPVAECPSHTCPSYGALGQEPMAGQEEQSQETGGAELETERS